MSRAKSKDHLHNNNLREKYMLMAGAQRVLQGGRHDRERLIMDRYRRENTENMPPQGINGPKGQSLDPHKRQLMENNNAIRLRNAQQELHLKYVPSSNSSRNPYQQYIPMS